MKTRRRALGLIVAMVAWLSLVPGPLGAQPTRHSKTTKTSHRRHSRHIRKSAAVHSSTHVSSKSHRPSKVRTAAVRRRHVKKARVPAWRTVRLQSDRVSQIQRSLADAGYLKTEPTGRWDDATRDAMRRYQAANGFPATGLPEAKSLMKLGLGPHPLPPDLDPTMAAQVNPGSTPGAPDAANSASSADNQ